MLYLSKVLSAIHTLHSLLTLLAVATTADHVASLKIHIALRALNLASSQSGSVSGSEMATIVKPIRLRMMMQKTVVCHLSWT